MDLTQTKLTKQEWQNIESPININLKKIVNIIREGYNDIDISETNTLTLLNYLKVCNTDTIDKYIYITYLEPELLNIKNLKYKKINSKKINIKKADKIRFNNIDKNLSTHKKDIFEFIIIDLIKNMYINLSLNNNKWHYYYYTLCKLKNILFNNQLKTVINNIIEILNEKVNYEFIIYNSVKIIQDNNMLLTYNNTELYKHQKDIFNIFKNKDELHKSKLVFYTAPTGTGKTLTPLGLSEQYKIIFVCAARHIGLSLAKNAININKKVAFSFGCDTEDDIRLHYFSAKKFDKNYKTGGIYKVDNSEGENVEIIISDIKSYLISMNYMLKFNNTKKIITYWDEPTITLDKDTHEVHEKIKLNCKLNKINNMVFSCATIPSIDKLSTTIDSFKNKFTDSKIYEINSYDCSKSIKLINSKSYVEMPHYIYYKYGDIVNSVNHINRNKTLLRYLDLNETVLFIKIINCKYLHSLIDKELEISRYFNNINSITSESIKVYYLTLILNISELEWINIYNYLNVNRRSLYNTAIHLTTTDSYTLTDGPTIYLTNDEDNIAKFLIRTADIPDTEINKLISVINNNNIIIDKINCITKILNEKYSDCKIESQEYKDLNKEIKILQNKIKSIELDTQYIPNFPSHINKYCRNRIITNNLFKCNIPESIIKKIMLINIDNYWKLLLIMGIGVFSNQKNKDYLEIMKYLADNQKLYLIIANSDYIYGTNYQFCHCYIGKDLIDISQEKLIQSFGRVGRTNKQLDYSIRFRNDDIIDKVFNEDKNNIETRNFNKLYIF